jgi:hypothetical protein
VRKISNGYVSTIGGVDTIGMDTTIFTISPGYRNGAADTSEFDNPTGLVVDDSGAVYVSDEYNNVIRKIYKGFVTTLAGTSDIGFVNGVADSSDFYAPIGIALDNHGNFYIGDNGNNAIREIYPPGVTGIKPIANENVHLIAYPNPSSSVMTIVSSSNGLAELMDLTGRTIWANDHFRSPYTFNTTDISPGVYFLKITADSQSAVCKVVIAR